MKKNLCFVLPFLFIISTLVSCKKSSDSSQSSKNKLIYIYKSDNTDAIAFKTLFEQNGCSVTILDRSSVAAFDFSPFNLVIIGNNTNEFGAGDWTTADSMAIQRAGKPLLLIGAGGMLFGNILFSNDTRNNVDWESCASNVNMTAFTAMDTTSILYKSPKHITVPANKQLIIYSVASGGIDFYGAGAPAKIALIGQETSSPNYYPITFESSRYGAFGFENNVNDMTDTGKDFFVNFVYYIGNLSL